MKSTPTQAIAAALLVLAASLWLMPQTPTIEPAEATQHEGRRVHLVGTALHVRHHDDLRFFDLAHDGHVVPVMAREEVVEGSWIRATGPLLRDGPELILRAQQVEMERPDVVPLSHVLINPPQHLGTQVEATGDVDQGWLDVGHARIQLRGGPAEGSHTIYGAVDYDLACACYALTVRAWNP